MFDYPALSTMGYKGQRWYVCGDEKAYPSITTILNISMPEEKKKKLDDWRNILGPEKAAQKSKEATDRGTNVHKMLEEYLNGESPKIEGIPREDIQVYNSIKIGLKKVTKIYGQEVALFSDVLQVAGRCDLAGMYKNEEAIIDFKTAGRSKSEKEIEDYWLQCTFYALAHNEMFGTDINKGVILMGVKDGLPLTFEKDLMQYVGPLLERIEKFYKTLTV